MSVCLSEGVGCVVWYARNEDCVAFANKVVEIVEAMLLQARQLKLVNHLVRLVSGLPPLNTIPRQVIAML